MPSQICQGKRLWDLSVFTNHKSFTFWFPTLQECLMGGFLSCSNWVWVWMQYHPSIRPHEIKEATHRDIWIQVQCWHSSHWACNVWSEGMVQPSLSMNILFLKNGNSSNLVIWIIDKVIWSCEYQLLQVTEKHNQYKLYREEYEAARKVW
jgi:hypothetical protein